jgi:hypothetical protein
MFALPAPMMVSGPPMKGETFSWIMSVSIHLGVHDPVHHFFQELAPVGPAPWIDLLQLGAQLLGRADDQRAQQLLCALCVH